MARITGLNRLAVEGIKVTNQWKYVLIGSFENLNGAYAAFNATNTIPGGNGTVEADGKTFLGNAFEFTEGDGRIKITLGFSWENDTGFTERLNSLLVYRLQSGQTVADAIQNLQSSPAFSANLVNVVFPQRANVLNDDILNGQVINVTMPTTSLTD